MNEYFVHGLAALGAGIAMLCCVGHGIGQGFATGKAVEAAGRNPEASSKIQALLVIGLALAETTGIFALIVAILLIFTK